MLLRSCRHLLTPSNYYLGCHPIIRIRQTTLIKYQVPLLAHCERGFPNVILHKKWIISPPLVNNFRKINYEYDNFYSVQRENIWTIPNILCISRIIITPYIGHLILSADYKLAFCILFSAGITDMLDGFIARNFYNQSSKLGSFLDPLADKILIVTLFTTMAYINLIPPMLTALIIARDISLAGAAFYIRYLSLPSPKTLSRYLDVSLATAQLVPTNISKINTAVQLVTVSITLTASAFTITDHPILPCCFALTAITTIASAVSYIVSKNTYKIFKNYSKKKHIK